MIPLDVPPWLMLAVLFVYGAVLGSFLNVCIYRIPQRAGFWDSLKGLWDRPSCCPRCKEKIRWQDNIPIIGWMNLRGRCRSCRMRISSRYPLVEFLSGLLFPLVYYFEVPAGWFATIQESCLYNIYGPLGMEQTAWLSPVAVVNWRYVLHMVLLTALLVATFIDLDLWIIPDGVTVPVMIVGVVLGTILGHTYILPVWLQNPNLALQFRLLIPDFLIDYLKGPAVPGWISQHPHLHGFAHAVVGMLVGAGVARTVQLTGRWVLRREALGTGDVILMAAIGSVIGWQAAMIVFFIAPALALAFVIVRRMFQFDREIPYGPFLALATLVTILFWRPIWRSAQGMLTLGPLLVVLAVMLVVSLVASLLLLQGIKWVLGIPLFPTDDPGEWTSADQLHYQSSEKVDMNCGQWPRSAWNGETASRGQLHEHRWRGRD